MRRAAVFIAVLAIAAGAILLALSLSGRHKTASTHGLKVTASVYPLAHLAQKTVGPGAEVFLVTPSGAASHDYEPTPRDIKRVSGSDVFIYNGAGLDPWADRIAPSLKEAGVVTVDISSHLELIEAPGEHEHGHSHDGVYDPHTWLDPVLTATQVKIIGETLAAADPANAPAYLSRSEGYAKELLDLDDEFSRGLADCGTRELIVAHDAFGYLAKRYALRMIPVTGIFSGEEPSPKKIAEITRLARDRSIKYIFFEPLSSPRIAQIIAAETGAQVLELNPIEGLTSDEEASGAGYISIMRANLINLRKALGCR